MNISITGQYSVDKGFQFMESNYSDVIAQSNKNFYYVDDTRDLIKKQSLNSVFENVLKQNQNNWDHISNQERAQIGKLSTLYQSLLNEKSLRFPLVFSDQILMCGYGRAIIADRYFPNIELPGIIISDDELPYLRIKNINDLMRIIMKYDYWKNKDLTNIVFGIVFDDNDIIHATDYQINDERFRYKFVDDAGKIDDQWQKVMSVIESYQNFNTQTVQEILDQLIKI